MAGNATINQQPHPQDPTPQRDHCIILRTRAQGREARDRIGEHEREAKKKLRYAVTDDGIAYMLQAQ